MKKFVRFLAISLVMASLFAVVASAKVITEFTFDDSNFTDATTNTSATVYEGTAADTTVTGAYEDAKFGKGFVFSETAYTSVEFINDAFKSLDNFSIAFWYKSEGQPYHARGRIFEFYRKGTGHHALWFTVASTAANDKTKDFFLQGAVQCADDTTYDKADGNDFTPSLKTDKDYTANETFGTATKTLITLSEWNHYTITCAKNADGTYATLKVYCNGTLVIENPTFIPLSALDTNVLTFGRSNNSAKLSVAGTLDQFYIFDEVIDEAMITRLMTTGYAAAPADEGGDSSSDDNSDNNTSPDTGSSLLSIAAVAVITLGAGMTLIKKEKFSK